jgi:hypothetical protein
MNTARIREDIARLESEMSQLKAMMKHNIADRTIVMDCTDKLRQLHARLVEWQKDLQRAALQPRA